MGIAATLGRADLIAKALREITVNRLDLLPEIREYMQNNPDQKLSIYEWGQFALYRGGQLPSDFAFLIRGMHTISDRLRDVGSTMTLDQLLFLLVSPREVVLRTGWLIAEQIPLDAYPQLLRLYNSHSSTVGLPVQGRITEIPSVTASEFCSEVHTSKAPWESAFLPLLGLPF